MAFVVVASQSPVGSDIEQLADYVIIDRQTVNEPHGVGELALVRAGLEIMERFNRPHCYKITYDFVIDHTNYWVLDSWKNQNRDFVSCIWRTVGIGVGSWAWWGTIEIQKQIFNSIMLDNYLEHEIRDSINLQGLADRCFFYETKEKMFYGGDDVWFSRCDLVHAGGTVLKHNYGSIITVARLTDENSGWFNTQLWNLINQSKKIDHLLIVDRRRHKSDIRIDDQYQMVLRKAVESNTTWNLIFDPGDDRKLLEYIDKLDHAWCWIVDSDSIPNTGVLENFYQQIMINFYDLGSLTDSDKNLFFRNHKIEYEKKINNLVEYILDSFDNTNYNNIMML